MHISESILLNSPQN